MFDECPQFADNGWVIGATESVHKINIVVNKLYKVSHLKLSSMYPRFSL